MTKLQIRIAVGAITVVLGCLPAAAAAADIQKERPELFRKLVDCRAVVEAQARLACFDASVAAIDTAEARDDIVVIDRQAVRKARRTLFGLTLPSFDLFGGKADDEQEEEGFSSIATTIKRASTNAEGKYVLILEDGAKWVQTERKQLVSDPKAGSQIKIRRAALGSFMANIDGQTAIRVRREN